MLYAIWATFRFILFYYMGTYRTGKQAPEHMNAREQYTAF